MMMMMMVTRQDKKKLNDLNKLKKINDLMRNLMRYKS